MIETWYNQDLSNPVKVQYLAGNVFSMDNNGNKVGVNVYQNGQPVELSGSISANVIRADGGTVTVTGTASGNQAYVVLPQACYTVPGVISIVIKNTVSSDVTTLCAVVANVYQSSTDTVVDPGTIIPSVQTLITDIETAVSSIPADYSALWTSLAPAFDSTKSYTAGQYVTYNGGVYRFTTSHNGSWAAGDATAVNIGGELSDVKSALNANIDLTQYTWELGSLTPGTGAEQSSTTRVRSSYISVNEGTRITITGNSNCLIVYAFNASKQRISDSAWTDGNTYVVHSTGGNVVAYVRILIRKNSSNSTIDSSEISDQVARCSVAYQLPQSVYFIPGELASVEGNVTTLQKKTTKLEKITDDISIKITGANLLDPNSITPYKTFDSSGNVIDSTARDLSDFIYVYGHSGESVYNTYGSGSSASDRDYLPIYAYCFYGADKSTIVSNSTNYNGNNFAVPSGAYYLRVSANHDPMNNRMMTYFGTGKVDYAAYTETFVTEDHEAVVNMNPITSIIPPKVWGVVGNPFSIYYYNIIQIDDLDNYHLYVSPTSTRVRDYGNRLWFSCTEAETFSIELTLRNSNNVVLLTMMLDVEIVSNNIPSIKALFIGDSFIDSGYILAQLMNKMGGSLTLYGTRGFTNVPDLSDTNRSGSDEGRAGWRLSQYWGSASVNGVTNAFYNGTSFNMSYYMTQNPSFVDTTDVFILSGANDAGWGVTNYMTNMEKIVNNIKSYSNSIRIHLLIPVTCCVIGYGYGSRSYQAGYDHRYRCIALANALIEKYKDDTSVILTPIHVDLDPENDFPTTTVAASDHNPTLVTVGNDNVHPSKYGYYGIASTIFGDIVANCGE